MLYICPRFQVSVHCISEVPLEKPENILNTEQFSGVIGVKWLKLHVWSHLNPACIRSDTCIQGNRAAPSPSSVPPGETCAWRLPLCESGFGPAWDGVIPIVPGMLYVWRRLVNHNAFLLQTAFLNRSKFLWKGLFL